MAKVEPKFSIPQSRALRVAISWALESEDAVLCRSLAAAKRELDRAELKAQGTVPQT